MSKNSTSKNYQVDRFDQQLSRRDKVDTRDQDINFVKRFSSKIDKDQDPELVYTPTKKIYKFYQVCSFKNPKSNMYDVRIVIFNEHSEVIKQTEYMYDEKQCNILIKSKNSNRLKIYSTFDIDLIGLPDMDDLLKGQSTLLN